MNPIEWVVYSGIKYVHAAYAIGSVLWVDGEVSVEGVSRRIMAFDIPGESWHIHCTDPKGFYGPTHSFIAALTDYYTDSRRFQIFADAILTLPAGFQHAERFCQIPSLGEKGYDLTELIDVMLRMRDFIKERHLEFPITQRLEYHYAGLDGDQSYVFVHRAGYTEEMNFWVSGHCAMSDASLENDETSAICYNGKWEVTSKGYMKGKERDAFVEAVDRLYSPNDRAVRLLNHLMQSQVTARNFYLVTEAVEQFKGEHPGLSSYYVLLREYVSLRNKVIRLLP